MFPTRYILGLIILFLSTIAGAVDNRPNVVLIISDDQGWNDYGFMGHPHINTPNIDKLVSPNPLITPTDFPADQQYKRSIKPIMRQI